MDTEQADTVYTEATVNKLIAAAEAEAYVVSKP
jgi:choline kinase